MRKILFALCCFLMVSTTCTAIDYVVSVGTPKDCETSHFLNLGTSPQLQGPFANNIIFTLTNIETGEEIGSWTINAGGLPGGIHVPQIPSDLLTGLEAGSYEITASIEVINNVGGGTSTFEFQEAGSGNTICGPQGFSDTNRISCNLGVVGCFDIEEDCFDIRLQVKNRRVRATVTGGEGPFSYSWAVREVGVFMPWVSGGSGSSTPVLCGEWDYVVIVTDLSTGCQEAASMRYKIACMDDGGVIFDPKDDGEMKPPTVKDFGRRTFDTDIRPFPNPAITTLNIGVGTASIERLSLIDMTGRVVQSLQLNGAQGNLSLDVASLNGGLYMLVLEGTEGEYETHKVSIIR